MYILKSQLEEIKQHFQNIQSLVPIRETFNASNIMDYATYFMRSSKQIKGKRQRSLHIRSNRRK